MAEMDRATTAPKRAADERPAGGKAGEAGFTAAEKAAVRERAAELKATRRGKGAGSGLEEMMAKVAKLPEADRVLAEGIHQVVMRAAPQLEPTTWYGMPAWAKDGRSLCFFQPASKFRARYAMFGFNDAARLDDGRMWPVYFAVTELAPEVEERIAALVRKAAD